MYGPVATSTVEPLARAPAREYVFYMLDDAIDLLPKSKLAKLVAQYIRLDDLRPDGGPRSSLLEQVRLFERESLAGKYYEVFNVNSKNCTRQSMGTRAWIAACHRLLDRCVVAAAKGDPSVVRQAFDILFGLLDTIDEFRVDIIFFADEAGSWQVGVDWAKVLPPWFAVLSATAGPQEYAERIGRLLDQHCGYECGKMLVVAAKAGTADQRAALAALPTGNRRRR